MDIHSLSALCEGALSKLRRRRHILTWRPSDEHTLGLASILANPHLDALLLEDEIAHDFMFDVLEESRPVCPP